MFLPHESNATVEVLASRTADAYARLAEADGSMRPVRAAEYRTEYRCLTLAVHRHERNTEARA